MASSLLTANSPVCSGRSQRAARCLGPPPRHSFFRVNASAFPPRGQPSPPQQPSDPAAAATRRPRKPHVWTVGVDFGTYASGFGFSKISTNPDNSTTSNNNNNNNNNNTRGRTTAGMMQDVLSAMKRADAHTPSPVKLHHNWPDQPLQDYKTRTVCLYRGSKLEAWGWTAWKRWSQMSEQERRDGNYFYVEEFKLLLLQNQGAQQNRCGAAAVGGSPATSAGAGAGRGQQLPPGVTEVQVIADFLSELRGYIYKHLAKMEGGTPLDPASISWCLTVPALWDEALKAKMRQAANRAGMARAADPGSLTLVLEPEAAAAAAVLHQQHRSRRGADRGDGDTADAAKAAELSEMRTGECSGGVGPGSAATAAATLRDGDVLLVLDCGGGTADITMHRVVGSGAGVRLQEAVAGLGVIAGGRFVDAALWEHLRSRVGASVWDKWQRENPTEWVQTATEWEAIKRQPRGPLSLQLRPNLMELARHQPPPATAVAAVEGPPLPADGCLVLSEEFLKRELYDPVVDYILAVANEVLDNGQQDGTSANKILLVGGMASSPYVQQRVRQLAQERGVPLLIPRQPQALVVSGAVLFGQYPALVTARRSRHTYGIFCRSLWTSEDAASQATFGYPTKLWKDDDREYVADGVFELYVRRNQLVQQDEVVRRTFCPTSKSTTAVGISLYATESDDARYTQEPGMRKVATVTMDLPPSWMTTVPRRQDYDIEVELRFGGTEITLVARDPRTNNAVATSVTWMPEVVTAAAAAAATSDK